MRILHAIAYTLSLAFSAIILLGGCSGVPQHKQIAQSEGLTLEEKIQELVYRGASRAEVVATFGEATGYTYDTLSYTVKVGDRGQITKMKFPVSEMGYADPGHPGDYRWVLMFDERGSLYDYRRVPIDLAWQRIFSWKRLCRR